MSKLRPNHTLIALAAAALVAACGGGDAPRSTAQTFADALGSTTAPAPSDRLRALGSGGGTTAAAAGPITNAQLFQGAEAIFPALFPTSPAPVTIDNLAHEGRVYQVKAYANGNYLGIASDGTLWGLGAYTGNVLTSFGTVQSYADLVCSRINCGGTGGTGGTGGSGSLNDCTLPASQVLVAGSRIDAVYVYNGMITGEQTVQSVVDGPGTFRGQSATQTTSTTTGSNTVSQGGFNITTTITTRTRSYSQAAANGLTRTLGALIEATTTTQLPSLPGLPPLPGTSTTVTSETYYTPPSENTEFTLSLGQSLTKNENITTTVTGGPGSGSPLSSTGSTTYTFEARESVTVPAGTFNSCRYRIASPADNSTQLSWFIVGKGVMAKSQQTSTAGTQTIELKSGTLNGQRL